MAINVKAHHAKEILRCGKDPIYFINKYVKIQHPTKGAIPFDTFDFQDDCVEEFIKHRFTIVLKARQLGLSTVTAAYALWMVLFRENANVLVIATKLSTAKNFIAKCKYMLKMLPPWLILCDISSETVQTIQTSRGSVLKAVPTSPDAGRSEALSLLIIDEAAFVRDFDELWKGLYPTLSCLTGDTLVLSDKGFKRIGDYFENKNIGDYFELNSKIWGKNGIEDISHGYVSPKSKVLEIRTQSGSTLKITPNHPLYSLKEGNERPKMIPGKYLSIGDHLRTSYGMNSFGDVCIDDDLAYMVGGFIAEGWMTSTSQEKNYTTWISNTDDSFRDIFIRNGFSPDKSNNEKLRICSVNFCDKLKSIGIEPKRKCYEKITPNEVFSWNKIATSKYLSALFDGDGSVSESGIVLSSTSEQLLQETKIILSNYGIYGNIHKSTDSESKLNYERKTGRLLPQGKPVQSLHDCWSIIIPRSQMKLFSEEIGFKIKRKQLLLEKYIQAYSQDSSKIFQIPKSNIYLKIKDIVKDSNKSTYWFRKNGLRLDKILDKNMERYVNQEFLRKLRDLIGENLKEKYSLFFEEYLSDTFRWDRIVSISESEDEVVTYDFTVPETHSFLQNGILGSNTGGRAILLSCVTENTWVFTDKGPTQVKNFIQQKNSFGGYEISEYSVLGKDKLRNGTLFHNNGKVETKKITTQHSWLEGSNNHKVWACVDGKYNWHRLDQLKEGDYIAYQYGMNSWGFNDDISCFSHVPSSKEKNVPNLGEKITKDLSYIFGMYLAEGSNYKVLNNQNEQVGNHLTITCGDDISNIFESIELSSKSYDNMHYNISSKSFGLFLEYVGFNLDLKAKEKHIPDRLLQMSKENIASMLSGLFDGDGYSRSDRGTIGISLSSKRLIEQIRILLNNFGIITDYYEGTSLPTEKVKVESKYYRIEINGRYSNIFYDEIGFGFERKQNNKEKLKECYNISAKNTKDIIPNSLGLLNEIYSYSSENLNTLYKKYGLFMNGILNKKTKYKTDDISRDVCLKFWNIVKDDVIKKAPEKVENIDNIISSNIKWDRIKNIEDGLEETYDFSLPDIEKDFWCHSVIYNGMLGHQTPNGTGNKFFDIYDKAEKKENEFYPIKLPWTVHPERDEKWFKEQTGNMTVKEIAQEHECDFAASGDTFLDPSIIEKLRKAAREPIKRVGEDRNIYIWEDSIPGHKYILSADVARGDGKDYSTFHIIDAEMGKVVAEYQGKLPPDRFAELINEFGLLYNKALVCPENNNVGYAVVQRLCYLNYPRIYNNKEKSLDIWSAMAGNDGDLQNPSGDLGIFTSGGKKNVLLTKMEEMLRNDKVEIYSDRLCRELKTFVWLGNHKVGADKKKNDDLVMSLAIGLWLLDTADFARFSEDQGKALLDAMSQSSSKLDDIIEMGSKKKDDYSVMLPAAGNASGFSRMTGKTNRVQVLNKNWDWLMK